MRESTKQKFANVDWSQPLEKIGSDIGVTRARAHQVKMQVQNNPKYMGRKKEDWWFNGDINWSLSNKVIAEMVGKTESCISVCRARLAKPASSVKRGPVPVMDLSLIPRHDWALSNRDIALKYGNSESSVGGYRSKSGLNRNDAVNALLNDCKALLETISTIESQLNSMKLILGNSNLLP